MATEPPRPATGRWVLNPFALPDATAGRYRLMVMTALILAYSAATAVRWLVAPDGTAPRPAPAAPALQLDDPGFFPAHQAYALALMSAVVHDTWPGIAGMAAVWWLARGIAARYPAWLRRRHAAQPLDPSSPAAAGLLGLLRQVSPGWRTPLPALEQCSTLTSQHAQAYGTDSSPVVLLGRGLQLQALRDPATTRAVLSHELAHVVNGDIGRTYRTWSLFLATGVVALLPLGIAIAGNLLARLATAMHSGAWDRFWALNLPVSTLVLLQGAGAAALLLLALAGFLRARETYADWRAAAHGHRAALLRILERNAGGAASHRPWWRPALHPTPGERAATLQQPLRLFGVTNGVAFLTGALGGMALPSLTLLVWQLALALSAVATLAAASVAGSTGGTLFGFLALGLGLLALVTGTGVPLLPVAYLLSATCGLEVQRSAAAQTGGPGGGSGGMAGLIVPAVVLVAGVQVGAALLPVVPVSPLSLYLLQSPLSADPLTVAPWSAVAAAAFWACLAVLRFWSVRFLGRHTGARPPVWQRRYLTLVLALLLAPLLLALVAGQWLASVPQGSASAWAGGALLPGFTVLAGVLIALGFAACWLGSCFLPPPPATCPGCGARMAAGATAHTRCPACDAPAGTWLYTAAEATPQDSP